MKFRPILAAVTASLFAAQAYAASDAQYDRILTMGELNGVALHCGYFDETRRMKAALISNLPKVRGLGKAFDDKTNQSFLAFTQVKSPCPGAAAFAKQVDQAILALAREFAADPAATSN